MAYARKTRDEYQIHIWYGGNEGWEHECTEATSKEARRCANEYRENTPQWPVKIVRRRVKIEAA